MWRPAANAFRVEPHASHAGIGVSESAGCQLPHSLSRLVTLASKQWCPMKRTGEKAGRAQSASIAEASGRGDCCTHTHPPLLV